MIKQIESIFFSCSSKKNFSSTTEKQDFFKKWAGDYFEYYSPYTYLAISQSDQKIAGYLTGCPDSATSTRHLNALVSNNLFSGEFNNYPAHLHINCHPKYQRMGIGQRLIDEFCQFLAKNKVPGVHIITTLGSSNIEFYEKLGFSHKTQKQLKSTSLLFMGKSLTPKKQHITKNDILLKSNEGITK